MFPPVLPEIRDRKKGTGRPQMKKVVPEDLLTSCSMICLIMLDYRNATMERQATMNVCGRYSARDYVWRDVSGQVGYM